MRRRPGWFREVFEKKETPGGIEVRAGNEKVARERATVKPPNYDMLLPLLRSAAEKASLQMGKPCLLGSPFVPKNSHVPEGDGAVDAAGRQRLAVRGEGEASDGVFVSFEGRRYLGVSGNVPPVAAAAIMRTLKTNFISET